QIQGHHVTRIDDRRPQGQGFHLAAARPYRALRSRRRRQHLLGRHRRDRRGQQRIQRRRVHPDPEPRRSRGDVLGWARPDHGLYDRAAEDRRRDGRRHEDRPGSGRVGSYPPSSSCNARLIEGARRHAALSLDQRSRYVSPANLLIRDGFAPDGIACGDSAKAIRLKSKLETDTMAERWGLPIVAWPQRLRPNYWDGIALPVVIGGILLAGWASQQMAAPYQPGQELPISLDPANLPAYGARTVLRMIAALAFSLIFSLGYAAIAAKSRRAEKLLIPILDILQSVPILGFLSITVTGFVALFPGSLLGYECAAIFAIFTSQAWNMTFSLYQSFLGVPMDLREAARMYHLTPWQSFWRLEVPYAMPQLTWNMMMSVSGGWF